MNAVPLLHDLLEDSAAQLARKVAVVGDGSRTTYAELDRKATAFANALVARGVGRGDRVLVYLDNSLEVIVSFWGTLKANAVAVVVNPQTRPDKLAYLLDDSGAVVLVTSTRLWGLAGAALEAATSATCRHALVAGEGVATSDKALVEGFAAALQASDDFRPPPRRAIDVDLAAIIYTSGSTGEPKGVMLTHRNMLTAASSIAQYLRLAPDDVILDALPLSFDYGLYQVIMATLIGATVVLERSFGFPMQVVETVAREAVTVFPGVPTMFALLAELRSLSPERFVSVRTVTNTAAALPLKHIGLIRQLFTRARLYSMYGLTECKRCTYLPPEDLERKPSSVGIAIPNTELWLVDEAGARLGPRQVGELVIRGATVMRGYWRKPEATREKLRPGPIEGEVVLYTGDYCMLDDDGYLYFVGRKDDVIKSRGEKVAPKEVEVALMDIVGVKEAAVIGVPDDVLGQALKAFVVLEEGSRLTERDLQAECQYRLEPFKVPKQVVLVSELAKTGTGKIKKTDLR